MLAGSRCVGCLRTTELVHQGRLVVAKGALGAWGLVAASILFDASDPKFGLKLGTNEYQQRRKSITQDAYFMTLSTVFSRRLEGRGT